MREILFKAKRIDNGEWVEGDLLHTKSPEIVIISDFENKAYRCDGNTLCQYTGLTDKNGNKIWENDILKIYQYMYGYDVVKAEKVEYIEGGFRTQSIDSNLGFCSNRRNVLVVGTIFDNPELLEVE